MNQVKTETVNKTFEKSATEYWNVGGAGKYCHPANASLFLNSNLSYVEFLCESYFFYLEESHQISASHTNVRGSMLQISGTQLSIPKKSTYRLFIQGLKQLIFHIFLHFFLFLTLIS